MGYPLRKCKCGNEHPCRLLDPVENGKRAHAARMAKVVIEQSAYPLPALDTPTTRLIAKQNQDIEKIQHQRVEATISRGRDLRCMKHNRPRCDKSDICKAQTGLAVE